MFDIITARDFLDKLLADYADFKRDTASARLALNCVLAAFHLHEWVWGDWLKKDVALRSTLGVRDYRGFLWWIDVNCPDFQTVQALANGTKHFTTRMPPTSRVSGYGTGPYGIGPFGKPYLLIDHGQTAPKRWQTGAELLQRVVIFWHDFFKQHHPDGAPPIP